MKKDYYCSHCGKKIKFTGNRKEWSWKVDELYQCGATCFSKEFDKRYKAFKTNIYGGCLGNAKGKIIDKGYERYGSR